MRAVAVVCLFAALLTAPPAAAQPAQKQTLHWLALGDSYSSGEGVHGAGDGKFGDKKNDPCSRSRFAWARLAANWVEKATDPGMRRVFRLFGQDIGDHTPDIGVDMTFLACSGAQTAEAGAAQDLDEQLAQATGKYDLITFSFGGNDAQFAPIIMGCLNPVHGYGCDESEDAIKARIHNEVAPKLVAAYHKIRAKLAPGGKVIVAGYPRLFDRPFLRATCFGLIPRADIQMLRRVADTLNGTIADLARRNDFDYVDVATPFEGRNACGAGPEIPSLDLDKWLVKETVPLEFTPLCLKMKWVNGISPGVEVGIRTEHSFHPNLCGHVVESLLVARRVLGWRATGDASAKPRAVDLYHGGLAVRIGDHETLQYQYNDPVAPVADHLTQLFGLPGPGDTVPVDPGSCGWADGMTWQADGAPVLTVCVRGDRFVGYLQHEPNPAVTAPDDVTAGAKVWRLLASSGAQVSFTDESRRIGGVVVDVHSYIRCDSKELGDPPQRGRLRDPADWTGPIIEVADGQEGSCTVAPKPQFEPVPPERYRQSFFYFFTSPDGRFNCGIAEDQAVCQGETQPVPPRPADCREGWGFGMGVDSTGAADFLCAGGLMYGPENRNPDDRDKLPAGHSLTAFGFTCSSDGTGIRCVHEASGHGFMVAPTTNDKF